MPPKRRARTGRGSRSASGSASNSISPTMEPTPVPERREDSTATNNSEFFITSSNSSSFNLNNTNTNQTQNQQHNNQQRQRTVVFGSIGIEEDNNNNNSNNGTNTNNNNNISSTSLQQQQQQQQHPVQDVNLLIQAANSASRVFDSSFNRATSKVQQSAETIHAVAESACSSIDQRTNLLSLCSTLAAENKVLKSTNEVLMEEKVAAAAAASSSNENNNNNNNNNNSSTLVTSQQQLQQQQQESTSSRLIATKAQSCINKSADTIRSSITGAIEATSKAQLSVLDNRIAATQANHEKALLVTRVKKLEHDLADTREQLVETEEALKISIQEQQQQEEEENTDAAASGGVFVSKQDQINQLRQALRILESKKITTSSNSNSNNTADASSSLLLSDALTFLDEQKWSVTELAANFQRTKSEEERLRQTVRTQSVEISQTKIKATELESRLSQSQWKITHLERLLEKTASNLNRTFESDILGELNSALNTKAATTVVLEDTKRKLQETSSKLSELEVKYESARELLNKDKMITHFENINRRRDNKVKDLKKKLSAANEKYNSVQTSLDEKNAQYDSLKNMVFTLQSSISGITNRVRSQSDMLKSKEEENQRLRNEFSRFKSETMMENANNNNRIQENNNNTSNSNNNNNNQQQSSSSSSTLTGNRATQGSFGGFSSGGFGSSSSSSNNNNNQFIMNSNNNNNNNSSSSSSSTIVNQNFIEVFARLEKAALKLVSSSNLLNNNNNSNISSPTSTSSSSWNNNNTSGSFGNINNNNNNNDSSSSSQLPIINHILKNFDEALQTAERVRVNLLGQITNMSLELDRLHNSHEETSAELVKTQTKLHQAEANIERSSGAFASSVLGRTTDSDDTELRIASLQRSVSRLEETEQQNKLLHDEIALLSQTVSSARERSGEMMRALAVAEGKVLASVLREEEAERETLMTTQFAETQKVFLLASLSKAAILDVVGGSNNTTDDENSNSNDERNEDSSPNSINQNEQQQSIRLEEISQQIKDALTPVQVVHQHLLDAVDSATTAEEEGLNSPTQSLAKVCTVLDSVLSYWRNAAVRDNQAIIVPSIRSIGGGGYGQNENNTDDAALVENNNNNNNADEEEAMMTELKKELESEKTEKEELKSKVEALSVEVKQKDERIETFTKLLAIYQPK